MDANGITKADFEKVLDEVKSAIMTENVNLKKKVDEAAQLLKDFPGHRNEVEWNAWMFRKDEFIKNVSEIKPTVVMDANGWRPISEAPKDGSKFLAGWFTQPRINGAKHWVEMIMQYKDNPYVDSQHLVSCPGEWHYEPTHFMPLPPPPAQEVK